MTATGGCILKNDNGGKAKWDVNVIYRQGPLTVSLGVNKQQTEKTGYVGGGRYNFGNYRRLDGGNNYGLGLRHNF